MICSKCHKPMVTRTGKYGTFWGCTGYPACRNTRVFIGASASDGYANGQTEDDYDQFNDPKWGTR